MGILLPLFSNAQGNEDASLRPTFGFSLGSEYTFAQYTPSQLEGNFQTKPGLLLGLQAQKSWSSGQSLLVSTSSGLNNSSLRLSDGNFDETSAIPGSSCRFGVHLLQNLKNNLFATSGLEWVHPLSTRSKPASEFTPRPDIRLTAGFGFTKNFDSMSIQPVIGWSHGLRNINTNPQLQSMHLRGFEFTLRFFNR